MSSQICTEPSVTTPIQKPQIYILNKKKQVNVTLLYINNRLLID